MYTNKHHTVSNLVPDSSTGASETLSETRHVMVTPLTFAVLLLLRWPEIVIPER